MTDEKDRALKLALERIANWNEHPATLSIDYGSNGVRDFYRNIAREALAEQPAQQQEPVARLWVLTDSVDMGQSLAPSRRYKTATATTYKAAMELPLGYYDLYTSPPASKPWVGLTYEERMNIINRLTGQDWVYAVDAIEAKLKEKNA